MLLRNSFFVTAPYRRCRDLGHEIVEAQLGHMHVPGLSAPDSPLKVSPERSLTYRLLVSVRQMAAALTAPGIPTQPKSHTEQQGEQGRAVPGIASGYRSSRFRSQTRFACLSGFRCLGLPPAQLAQFNPWSPPSTLSSRSAQGSA
jgi:hypothetical protein